MSGSYVSPQVTPLSKDFEEYEGLKSEKCATILRRWPASVFVFLFINRP